MTTTTRTWLCKAALPNNYCSNNCNCVRRWVQGCLWRPAGCWPRDDASAARPSLQVCPVETAGAGYCEYKHKTFRGLHDNEINLSQMGAGYKIRSRRQRNARSWNFQTRVALHHVITSWQVGSIFAQGLEGVLCSTATTKKTTTDDDM